VSRESSTSRTSKPENGRNLIAGTDLDRAVFGPKPSIGHKFLGLSELDFRLVLIESFVLQIVQRPASRRRRLRKS
jgi:hypothetical protein